MYMCFAFFMMVIFLLLQSSDSRGTSNGAQSTSTNHHQKKKKKKRKKARWGNLRLQTGSWRIDDFTHYFIIRRFVVTSGVTTIGL